MSERLGLLLRVKLEMRSLSRFFADQQTTGRLAGKSDYVTCTIT